MNKMIEKLQNKKVALYGLSYFDLDTLENILTKYNIQIKYLLDDFKEITFRNLESITLNNFFQNQLNEQIDFILILSSHENIGQSLKTKIHNILPAMNVFILKDIPQLNDEFETQASKRQITVDPTNISQLISQNIQKINCLNIETTTGCNLRCSYCHILQDSSVSEMNMQDFHNFMKNITNVKEIQFGCNYEATIDKRLIEFIRVLKEYIDVEKLDDFRIQTNGLLIHKLDLEELRSLGINKFSISLDSIDPKLLAQLRGGTDFKVLDKNIKLLVNSNLGFEVKLMSVLTKQNFFDIENIIKYAIENHIKSIRFREVDIYEFIDSSNKDNLSMNRENLEFIDIMIDKYKKQIDLQFNRLTY